MTHTIPIPQDPQPSTSFGTHSSGTLPKVVTFGQGIIAPLGNRTLTIGCGCGMTALASITPSPHRVMHNDSIQIYEEPPAPVRCRHSLANWTSVRLGNDPNNHTVDESTMGQQDFNLIIDPADQESNNNQDADQEIMYSNYSTDHLEDLE